MKPILKQHNAITEARYDMSALEKNLVYLLMSKLEDDDPPQKEYVILLSEIEEKMGKTDQETLRKATTNLLRRSYHIETEEGNILVVSLMTVVKYDGDEGTLSIKISSKLLPLLLELKKDMTVFELDMVLALDSKYSKRFYEMISQHKAQGGFSITVEDLKWRLGVLSKDKKKDKYPVFSMFKDTVLEVAKREIEEKTDLCFYYEAAKTGNKFTHLTFKIREKPKQLKLL